MPDQIQRDHEKFTAEKIVSLCRESAIFDRFGDPVRKEPDIIFSGKQVLGIEVTLTFYHGGGNDPNFHPREHLRFIRRPTFDEHGVHRFIDPNTGRPRIWDRMEERLTTSCQKALN